MPRHNRQPVTKPLKERFSINDIVNLTEEDINLLAEIDAEVMQAIPPKTKKTLEEQTFEQRLLERLVAHTS